MRNALPILTFILLFAGVASHSHAQTTDIDFLLGVDPLSALISPDVDDFEASDGNSVEMIDGNTSLYPSLKAGVGIDFPQAYLDLTAGVGYLWNDAFSAVSYYGDLAFLVKVDEKGIFAVGPHLGPVYFDPDWDGDADIELKSTSGLLGGIKFYVGGNRVKFSGSIDYLNATLDADGKNGWTPSQSELDLSGFAAQFGVLFRF